MLDRIESALEWIACRPLIAWLLWMLICSAMAAVLVLITGEPIDFAGGVAAVVLYKVCCLEADKTKGGITLRTIRARLAATGEDHTNG